MKAELERKPAGDYDMLEEHRLRSLLPTRRTRSLSDFFINNNQDLRYQLITMSSPKGLESGDRCRGRAVCQ
jgi:hypothetical protein